MNTSCDILLVTPPLLQLNTPYPATAYLKAFLTAEGFNVGQVDLSIETFNALLSETSMRRIFDMANNSLLQKNSNLNHIYQNRESYLNLLPSVLQFLQGKHPELAHRIASRQLLPEAERFRAIADMDWAFGTLGVQEKASHIATLFLEDVCTFIRETASPHFEPIRYAEKLATYAPTFDKLQEEIDRPADPVMEAMEQLLRNQMITQQPKIVGFTVPFPGNLVAALRGCRLIKKEFSNTITVLGGGFPTTELRSLTDTRIFAYANYVVLDDGLSAIRAIAQRHISHKETAKPTSTWYLENNKLQFSPENKDDAVKFAELPCPDFTDLPHHLYLGLLDMPNPMHQLWSNGRWNKLMMAHGCYWAGCTFCDTTLPYIQQFEPLKAVAIANHMEQVAAQTGSWGFHFVDEAAPPRLLKELSLEIIRRKLPVTWWTNIRFEKTFTPDLCRLMAAAGCIAVSGGIEVASDRILQLINKGVSVDQATIVTRNFSKAGIMTHAYLMYGFPTETLQETIDSLEVVRQLFEGGNLQSAFWHRFAMTEHSPVGKNPENFGAKRVASTQWPFANNEVPFTATFDHNLQMVGEGLRVATYNYMQGLGFDLPLHKWFSGKIPQPTHLKSRIKQHNQTPVIDLPNEHSKVIWLGGVAQISSKGEVEIAGTKNSHSLHCNPNQAQWLVSTITAITTKPGTSYADLKESFENETGEPLELFLFGKQGTVLRKAGLLIV